MADFSWLNDIPDSGWVQTPYGGIYRSFLLDDFLARSNAVGDNNGWQIALDSWGAEQSRRYGQFTHPPIFVPGLGERAAVLISGSK